MDVVEGNIKRYKGVGYIPKGGRGKGKRYKSKGRGIYRSFYFNVSLADCSRIGVVFYTFFLPLDLLKA